jgi:multidrug resistance protein MdtO
MTMPTETTSRWRELYVIVREELAPRPGRGAAVARIALCCAVTVAVGMVFQIPLPAYMAYIVFLVSREEAVGTLITAIGGAVAATLAVAFSLLLYTLDAAEPALRLPLMAASTFLGMFLVRTSTLGPIAFLASFVLVLTQTLIDDVPSLEILTRFVLWLWVVVALPATLTVVVNLIRGENPATLARKTALRLLDTVTVMLEGRNSSELAESRAEALGLLELQVHAGMFDRRLRARTGVDRRLIETLIELLMLVRALPAGTPPAIRAYLVDASKECRRAFASDHAVAPVRRELPGGLTSGLNAETLSVVTAIENAVGRLGDDIVRRRTTVNIPAAKTVSSLFVPDALSNPEHVRFALKTTMAVMAAYIIYTALDWPGIRTAVTTCFFVALGSLGETMHKLTLRLCGALLGGLAAGLCIVYLLPQMTDIGQLCLLIAAASAISAWFATSSERLSYLGLQMAFAFFLGVLQDYGPGTDLTVLRDRMVGILFGNLLMSIVFSVVWPTSALDQARAVLAKSMRALANLMGDVVHPETDMRLVAVQNLTEARHFASIALFEMNLLEDRSRRKGIEETALAELDGLATAVFVVAGQSLQDGAETVRRQDLASSAWLAESAKRIEEGQDLPVAPSRAGIAEAHAIVSPAATPLSRAAVAARELLQRKIEYVASAFV